MTRMPIDLKCIGRLTTNRNLTAEGKIKALQNALRFLSIQSERGQTAIILAAENAEAVNLYTQRLTVRFRNITAVDYILFHGYTSSLPQLYNNDGGQGKNGQKDGKWKSNTLKSNSTRRA